MATGAGTTKRYIHGVKILLDQPKTQDTTIGLYNTTFGDATSQWDVVNYSGDYWHYIWDGTGTGPSFVANGMEVGSVVVVSGFGLSGNNGTFRVLEAQDDRILVENASGVLESNRTNVTMTGDYSFRWIQVPMTNTTQTWKDGIIIKNGMGKLGQGADFRRGGNIVKVKGTSVTVTNTIGSNQFWKKLQDLDFSLNGLRATVIEFNDEVSHNNDRSNETVLFTGECNAPSGWTETQFTIPIKNTLYKRKANIATVIDNDPTNGNFPDASDEDSGKAVPATFGKHSKAMFQRTASRQDVFDNTIFFQAGSTDTYSPAGLTIFPVVFPVASTTPTTTYVLAIASSWKTAQTPTDYDLTGKFLYVIEGNGKGQFRRISSSVIAGLSLTVAVDSHFSEILQGNSTATATDQSWVQIVDIYFSYNSDVWQCKAYLDEDGSEITQGLNLFGYTDEKTVKIENEDIGKTKSIKDKPLQYIRLPRYAYEDSPAGLTNQVDIDVKLFEESPDRMNSFLILPVTSPVFATDATLTDAQWGLGATYWLESEGLYLNVPPDMSTASGKTIVSGALTNLVDQFYSSGINITFPNILATTPDTVAIAVKFAFPAFPGEFTFDDAYFGIRGNIDMPIGTGSTRLLLAWRRFMGADHNIKDITQVSSTDGVCYWDDLPDFYYTVDPSTNNENFYVERENTIPAVPNPYLTGYKKIPISDITSKEQYESIQEALFFTSGVGSRGQFDLNLYEFAVIFRKEISIKDAIYSGFEGRVTDDTWGGRVADDDLINNPKMAIEHVLRLQNWSEVGDIVNYGKAYSPQAQINTTDVYEGGLDYPELDILDDYEIARQITTLGDAWTDKVIKSLCQQFFLASVQDNQGQENLTLVVKNADDPTVTIDLSDIIPGSIGKIKDLQPEHVFPEMVVRYNYDTAQNRFLNVIRVTNAAQATFDTSYVTGYAGAEAERLWDMAHALYQHYRSIEEPPAEITDLSWITREEDAERYLFTRYEYMGCLKKEGEEEILVLPPKRIPFAIPYDTAFMDTPSRRPWFPGMHFMLSLPHQTDGVSLQCIVEDISFDLNREIAMVKAILLNAETEIAFYIQKVAESRASVGWADWQKVSTTQAEEPSQSYDFNKVT